jgi:ATP-dependent DNA helicase DinG
MAGLVRSVFMKGGVGIVEAGTGTGKTLAYLIPAVAEKRRVVVSTATKSLQEQLVDKDVPFLMRALNRPFTAVCMKGRANYVCRHKIDQLEATPFLTGLADVDEFEVVRRWAEHTTTGDRAELTNLPESLSFWPRIDARSESCLGTKCPRYDDCFITEMRRRAEEADLVVVNHHLFFADLALKNDEYGKVLPDYELVVFDEAHELEETAASFFGCEVSTYRVDDLVRDTQALALDRGVMRDITNAAARLVQRSDRFWSSLAESLRAGGRDEEARGEITAPLFVDQHDGSPTALGQYYLALRDNLQHLGAALSRVRENADAVRLGERARILQIDFDFLVAAEDPNFVYWYERRGRGAFLRGTPIEVAKLLEDRLFGNVPSVVLTSATLTTAGSFAYLRSRLGIEEATELTVPSQFDFARQALLYLPARIPEPREPAFQPAAVDAIVDLLEASRGRAFVLFTSIQQMKSAYAAVSARVEFPTWLQGQSSKAGLLEQFRNTEGSVLFATSSFWQGIDVQGEALSLVVIVKLPFAVPTDPVVAARSRAIESRGGIPFRDYQVPEAVISLKQGVGRLIRSCTDRGVVAILDSRVRTKNYGSVFLQSLPPLPVTTNIDHVRRFFG